MDQNNDDVSREAAQAGLGRWDASPFLEKVAAIAPSIVYVYNQQTQSNEYSNRSLGVSMGYSPEEIQAMGAELMPRLCHPDDLPRMFDYFTQLQAMEDGKVSQFVYRMKRKTGGWAHLLSYDTIFERDEQGQVLRHIGVATDITAQKEAEEALLDSNRQLKVLNEELTELAYASTHDMKSPLNNILGLAKVLKDVVDPDNAPALELIEMMLQSCEQANVKIHDFVNVIQTRTAFGEGEVDVLSLEDIMASVCDVVRSQLDEAEAVVDCDFSAAPRVTFSRLQLEGVFGNLMSNALKYRSPARPLRIEVRSRRRRDGVEVTFRDNGIGLDTTKGGAWRFGLFKRGKHQDIPGSGIGLYLVRQILRRAGGEISIEGVPDKGAVLTLRFKA